MNQYSIQYKTLVEVMFTQEADSPKCSKSMPKVVVGVPWVLKVFSWVFIYKVYKNTVFGPKKLVQPS